LKNCNQIAEKKKQKVKKNKIAGHKTSESKTPRTRVQEVIDVHATQVQLQIPPNSVVGLRDD
jgi:hypothetical protein